MDAVGTNCKAPVRVQRPCNAFAPPLLKPRAVPLASQRTDQESTQVIFIRNQQVIKIQPQSSGSMLRDTLG